MENTKNTKKIYEYEGDDRLVSFKENYDGPQLLGLNEALETMKIVKEHFGGLTPVNKS